MALDELDEIPRVGWVDEPSPVVPLPALARSVGVAYLGAKRDDLIAPLFGGSKVRKLDYQLAAPRYVDAPAWAAMGAIGSGQLVATTAAADELGKHLHAYVFWEPISEGVLDNLAFVAGGPTTLHYHRSRVSLALRRPGLLSAREVAGAVTLPPGVTSPRGMVGIVRAALELGEQIQSGEVPPVDRIYVACGTGGTAAGLAVGLGMAGVSATVHAVAVVERVLASGGRLRRLERSLSRWLRDEGVTVAEPNRVVIERRAVGPGYGRVSPESLAACERAADHGLRLEPIYTGKAMAALLADTVSPSDKILFWNTVRRDPLPLAEDWEGRLPAKLAARLTGAPARPGRRRVLLAGAALVTLGAVYRCTGYPTPSGFEPAVLWDWEVEVLRAVAEVMLAPSASAAEIAAVPDRVDRYLRAQPSATQQELHAAFLLLEHGTTPFGVSLSRLSRAAVADRERYLAELAGGPDLLRQAYRGMRDLCMLGYYQQPSSWAGLDYEGPLLSEEEQRPDARRKLWPAYEAMRAPPGALPQGTQ